LRFLHEDPWQRLRELRLRIPNIFSKCCSRRERRRVCIISRQRHPGIRARSVRQGIESSPLRSLNSIENMRVAIDAVLETGAVCEPAICYTATFSTKAAEVFAQVIKSAWPAIGKARRAFLAIKDMAGLCKPYASFHSSAPFAKK